MLGEITPNLGEEDHSTEAKGCENDNKREGLAEGKQVVIKGLARSFMTIYGFLFLTATCH